jgi:uncharacterized phosphosugar-binding protein
MSPARALLDRLEATQSDALDRAASVCADAIGGGGLVHMFGTGHSRIAVEEMFPRYGSYPGFNPIVELSMTFHTQVVGANGQRQAMFIERIEGLGEEILKNFSMAPPDAMVVVSAAGHGAVAIDVALGARERGLPVIVLTSVEASEAGESSHSSGTRLHEHADVVLDLCTPPGDALVALDGLDTPVGPGSTVASVALVNELKVRTAALLHARDALPPVLTSPALVGADDSRALFEAAYDEHGRRLGRALAKNGAPMKAGKHHQEEGFNDP